MLLAPVEVAGAASERARKLNEGQGEGSLKGSKGWSCHERNAVGVGIGGEPAIWGIASR